jgi:hypothetical protein
MTVAGSAETRAVEDDVRGGLEGFAAALTAVGVWGARAVACVVFSCEGVFSEEPNGSAKNWPGGGNSLHEVRWVTRWRVVESPVCRVRAGVV